MRGGDYFERVNVQGTATVLAAAAQQRVKRFVFCSTAGIYGRNIEGVANEESPLRPWNDYENSKVAAEKLVRERAPVLGIEYVILRPSVVYGPRDDRLAKLFRSASKGRFPLFGSGKGRRQMVHVTDVADAFLRACERPEAANTDMIIAGPDAMPLRDMLQILAHAADRRSAGPQLPLTPMLALAAAGRRHLQAAQDQAAHLSSAHGVLQERCGLRLQSRTAVARLGSENPVKGWPASHDGGIPAPDVRCRGSRCATARDRFGTRLTFAG